MVPAGRAGICRELQRLCCFPPGANDTKHSLVTSLLFPWACRDTRQGSKPATTAPAPQDVCTCGTREGASGRGTARGIATTSGSTLPQLPLRQTDAAEPKAPRPLQRFKAKRMKCSITAVFHGDSFAAPLCSTFLCLADRNPALGDSSPHKPSATSRATNANPRAACSRTAQLCSSSRSSAEQTQLQDALVLWHRSQPKDFPCPPHPHSCSKHRSATLKSPQ